MDSYKISKLQVTNFRNLQNDIIEFAPNINCIMGENGNGKTNLLEAVHVLATNKSFRKNAGFPQYLGIDGEKPEILFSATFTVGRNPSLVSYTGKIEEGRIQWFCDGKPVKRGHRINVVFINPFDAYGFHHVAQERRSWFDRHISMLDAHYKASLSKYRGLLRFRNGLLRETPNHYREQITALDREFAHHSKILTDKRDQFIREIEVPCKEVFGQTFSEQYTLTISLDSRVKGLTEKGIYDTMRSRFSKDQRAKMTTYGVHKDDYVFFLDGLNTFDYSSLGQQKMGYLGLLFAYIRLFRYKIKTFPIVLIDDVSGELDKVRWMRLVRYLEKSEFQVLITTANEKFRDELEKIKGANKLFVQSGSIERISE